MLYIIIFFVPFLNFFFLSFFGSVIGYNGCCFITGLLYSIMVISSYILFWNYACLNNLVLLNFGKWVSIGNLNVSWLFVFDGLSVLFLVLVSTISFVVHFYSFFYMFAEAQSISFMGYISLFTFFMIILISSSDLIVIFLGWEGVGLCSFLLISFWNTSLSACKAGFKAVLFNKIGDISLFAVIAFCIHLVGSTNIFILNNFLPFFYNTADLTSWFNLTLIDLIFFFLAVSIISNSAQIGMHVWLLDAMEGPTPVSALIHSATMVTAGVFLMLRFSYILDYAGVINIFLATLGIVTSLCAALAGSLHNDFKSIIAYSTCSQLGYMVSLCSISAYKSSFFHLFNHGFFKALLFLSAGLVIHSCFEEQDIRSLGGLYYTFPFSFSLLLIGSLSISGFPYLSGFYSNDFLLDSIGSLPFYWSNFVYQVAILSALLTSLYSVSLLKFVFFSAPRSYRVYYESAVESIPLFVICVLSVLLLCSVISGFYFSDVFVGIGSNILINSISSTSLFSSSYLSFEFFLIDWYYFWIPWNTGLIYLIFVFLRIYTLISVLGLKFYESAAVVNIYYFFYNGLFFNYFYINYILSAFYSIGVHFYIFDVSFFGEYLGPRSLISFMSYLSNYLLIVHLSNPAVNVSYINVYFLGIMGITAILFC